MSPHNYHSPFYLQNNNMNAQRMITPIDMNGGQSHRGCTDDWDEYDEDDIYVDNGGHQTFGAPNVSH